MHTTELLEFRSLLASQRTLLLGTVSEPADLAATRYLLVWLLQYREGSEDNAKSAIQGVLRTAAGYSGAVVWNTRIDSFGVISLGIMGLIWVRRHTTEL